MTTRSSLVLKRAALAFSLAAVSVVVAGVWLARPAAPAATAISAPRLSLPAGRFVEHAVMLEQTTQAMPFTTPDGGSTMVGKTALSLRLVLDGLPAAAGEVRARASFGAIESASVEVAAQQLVDDGVRQALARVVVEATFADTGELRSLSVPSDGDPTAARVMQLVLDSLQLIIADEASYLRKERTLNGDAESRYTLVAKDNGATVARTRASYRRVLAPNAATSEVRSKMEAQVARRGVVERFAFEELLVARDSQGREVLEVHTDVKAYLTNEGTRSSPASAVATAMTDVDPHRIEASQLARERMIADRLDGLTRAELKSTLEGAKGTGNAPDHHRFLWRATGLLRVDEGAVDDVAALAVDASAGHGGRALALDLLVGAGTERAQRALTEALEHPTTAQDPAYSRLYQRLALVRSPTPATVAFLDEKARSEGPWRDPARIGLGAATRRMMELGDGDGATRAAEALLALDADDARGKEVLLLAFGNAAHPLLQDAIVAAGSAPTAQMRHVAAEALRLVDTPEGRGALLSLARDPHAAVSARALHSLEQHTLDEGAFAMLASDVEAGAIPQGAFAPLITLCAKNREAAGAGVVLEKMIAGGIEDSRVLASARGALKSRR